MICINFSFCLKAVYIHTKLTIFLTFTQILSKMDINSKFVITINRELGSGGRTIGKKLAEKLGVKFLDKALIEALVKELGLSVEEIEKRKARKQNWFTEFLESMAAVQLAPAPFRADGEMLPYLVTAGDIFETESKLLREIASQESCVIAGRSGFFILNDFPNKISIFITASRENRIRRVMERQGLSEAEAAQAVDAVDKGRENYTQHYSGTSRYDARNYDLVLNVDGLSEDEAADIILQYCNKKG